MSYFDGERKQILKKVEVRLLFVFVFGMPVVCCFKPLQLAGITDLPIYVEKTSLLQADPYVSIILTTCNNPHPEKYLTIPLIPHITTPHQNWIAFL